MHSATDGKHQTRSPCSSGNTLLSPPRPPTMATVTYPTSQPPPALEHSLDPRPQPSLQTGPPPLCTLNPAAPPSPSSGGTQLPAFLPYITDKAKPLGTHRVSLTRPHLRGCSERLELSSTHTPVSSPP